MVADLGADQGNAPSANLIAFFGDQEEADVDPVLAGGGSSLDSGSSLPEIGTKGVAVSDLHPSGEVEIDNKRYQASVRLGTVQQGTEVIVTGYKDFRLLVDKDET